MLTNPTTGGVSASYAMLGDIQIAEPGALIGFCRPAGDRADHREKLPEGFQRAEYLMEHGMVDMVVPRQELKPTIARLLKMLMNIEPDPEPPAEPEEAEADEPEGEAEAEKTETAEASE